MRLCVYALEQGPLEQPSSEAGQGGGADAPTGRKANGNGFPDSLIRETHSRIVATV